MNLTNPFRDCGNTRNHLIRIARIYACNKVECVVNPMCGVRDPSIDLLISHPVLDDTHHHFISNIMWLSIISPIRKIFDEYF